MHRVAVGACDGTTTLHVPAAPVNRLTTISSTVDPTVDGPAAGRWWRRTVPCASLDKTLGPEVPLDLVKLDVEGGELAVLGGARRIVERSQPDVVLEVMLDDDGPPDAVSWLLGHGYRTFDMTPRGPALVPPDRLRSITNQRRSAQHRYGEVLVSRRTDPQITALAERVRALRWSWP